MKAAAESALIQILLADSSVSGLVGERVTWDDQELDLAYPSITLRLLATAIPGQLTDEAGIRNPLVEIAAHDSSSTGASELCDAIVEALIPYRNRNVIDLDGGGSVTFAAIRLTDVQQYPASREASYRKTAFFSVWVED